MILRISEKTGELLVLMEAHRYTGRCGRRSASQTLLIEVQSRKTVSRKLWSIIINMNN